MKARDQVYGTCLLMKATSRTMRQEMWQLTAITNTWKMYSFSGIWRYSETMFLLMVLLKLRKVNKNTEFWHAEYVWYDIPPDEWSEAYRYRLVCISVCKLYPWLQLKLSVWMDLNSLLSMLWCMCWYKHCKGICKWC